MLRQIPRSLLLIGFLCLLLPVTSIVQAQQEPVVRALLFYSPTCPHCHQVVNEVLLPMVEEHGDRLQILAVDVSQAGGQELYQAAIEHFRIPEERLGVPTLVVGDTVLVGSGEIPAQFPAIVNDGLATGIDWPAIPGLDPSAGQSESDPEPTPTRTPAATATPVVTVEPTATGELEAGLALAEASPPPSESQPAEPAPGEGEAPFVLDSEQGEMPLGAAEEPPADTLGFALATTILVAMIVACAYAAWQLVATSSAWRQPSRMSGVPVLSRAIPLIAVAGIGIAAYLAYVEINQVEAVCGPIGHCNLVQSSSYARILGVPIALLGIGTYLAIIGLWIVHWASGPSHDDESRKAWQSWALPALIGLTIFGTLFSIYLTLLELLVIRAICSWCLSSAVAMTILMLLAVRPLVVRRELAAG